MYLYVANVCSPGEFYGHVSSNVTFLQLPELLSDSCELLWQQNPGGRVDLAKIGTLKKHCLTNVMVKLVGNSWLRCSMVEKGDSESGGQVSITLMDGGRRLTIPSTTPAVRMTQSIKQLPSAKFGLHDVLPVIGEKNAWPKSSREIFSSFALNKVFLITHCDGNSVTLNDVKTGESVGLKLVKQGVARPASGIVPPMIPSLADLPMESRVFLERTGGLNSTGETCTGVSFQAILRTVNQSNSRR